MDSSKDQIVLGYCPMPHAGDGAMGRVKKGRGEHIQSGTEGLTVSKLLTSGVSLVLLIPLPSLLAIPGSFSDGSACSTGAERATSQASEGHPILSVRS